MPPSVTQADKLNMVVETVGRLVRRGAMSNLCKIFDTLRAVEISHVLQKLARPDRRLAFRALYEHDLDKCSEALTEIGTEVAVRLIEGMEIEQIEHLLAKMAPDDQAPFIDALPDELREELLAKMQVEEKAEVEELLSFPSETAGRIMTPNVFSLEEDLTVDDAISELQKITAEHEMVFYIYVVDQRNHLVGIISLRQLLQNAPHRPLKDFMTTDVISVRTHTDQEEVAREVANYNLLAVPVVDEENKLVGIVTVDDVIDVIREEAQEDLFALAGIDATDRALGTPFQSMKRRIPWLILSPFAAFSISVFVIDRFRDVLLDVKYAILLPLVAAMGGHAATQTLTVVVRGISTGEVTGETGRRAFAKEFVVGGLNGIILGLTAAGLTWGFFGPKVAAVICVSLLFLMTVAAVVGTLVPITLKRLNFDPAIASSLFVITMTDMLGFLAFLGLAVAALKYFPDVAA